MKRWIHAAAIFVGLILGLPHVHAKELSCAELIAQFEAAHPLVFAPGEGSLRPLTKNVFVSQAERTEDHEVVMAVKLGNALPQKKVFLVAEMAGEGVPIFDAVLSSSDGRPEENLSFKSIQLDEMTGNSFGTTFKNMNRKVQKQVSDFYSRDWFENLATPPKEGERTRDHFVEGSSPEFIGAYKDIFGVQGKGADRQTSVVVDFYAKDLQLRESVKIDLVEASAESPGRHLRVQVQGYPEKMIDVGNLQERLKNNPYMRAYYISDATRVFEVTEDGVVVHSTR
ncbi:MAG TPA: hypothetical protein VM901_06335 [Bdellovibrionota bacterium]|nr:hypothetical protein [Bdellovibrionota bacterium]